MRVQRKLQVYAVHADELKLMHAWSESHARMKSQAGTQAVFSSWVNEDRVDGAGAERKNPGGLSNNSVGATLTKTNEQVWD